MDAINRHITTSDRPAAFGEEPEDDAVASGVKFFLVSLSIFLGISFAAIQTGIGNIEENLEGRSIASLRAAGFPQVNVLAEGTVIHLSGSITTDQQDSAAFAAVSGLVGVSGVEGKLWPVFSGELEEVEITGDAIEIKWEHANAVVKGNVASTERKLFIEDTLRTVFSDVNMDGLIILEDLR